MNEKQKWLAFFWAPIVVGGIVGWFAYDWFPPHRATNCGTTTEQAR